MRNLLLSALAIICFSCHKSNTTPVYPKENILWKNSADSNLQLTFIHDTLTMYLGGQPGLISPYADLGHDTIMLADIQNSKAIVKPTKDSLSYTNIKTGQSLMFFK